VSLPDVSDLVVGSALLAGTLGGGGFA